VTLFSLGQLVATPDALAEIEASGDSLVGYLNRHVTGDWGDLDEHDRKENDLGLKHDLRILSAYILSSGVRIWIITEADRSSTCVLLPEEY
jgi:hypothetical protein